MSQFERKPSQHSGGRRTTRHGPSITLIPTFFAIALLTVLVTAACAGLNDSGTSEEALLTREARQNPPPSATGSPDASGSPGGDTGNLAATGQQLYTSQGCVACHSVDGSAGVGPSWQGIVGRETPLKDGSTVTADVAYITESIHAPQAKIHEGFDIPMPEFPQLSDEDINALIAYMETLQ